MTKKIKHNEWQLLMADDLSEFEGKGLFEAIQNGDYQIAKSLKDHDRSTVKRIALLDKDLVVKIPNEKNTRIWIRLMSWFRKGEAWKNIQGMEKLWRNGIATSVPIMAAEKRAAGMVVDSWLVYEYLEGESCLDRPDLYPAVVAKLKEMHQKKLLHGDPQIRNFISAKGSIYVIDSNPRKVGNAFDRAYEWAYLRKSAPGIEDYFGEINDWWLYKLAFRYDVYERKFKRAKRKLF